MNNFFLYRNFPIRILNFELSKPTQLFFKLGIFPLKIVSQETKIKGLQIFF